MGICQEMLICWLFWWNKQVKKRKWSFYTTSQIKTTNEHLIRPHIMEKSSYYNTHMEKLMGRELQCYWMRNFIPHNQMHLASTFLGIEFHRESLRECTFLPFPPNTISLQQKWDYSNHPKNKYEWERRRHNRKRQWMRLHEQDGIWVDYK